MGLTTFSWQNDAGIRIHAQHWQPAGKVRGAVALVHGLGEHTGRYQHVAAALNARGYAVAGFDLPGHGRSGGTRGHTSYEGILDEIDRLLGEINQRYPGLPRFLYGHSLGGALVLYYALKRSPALQGVIATSPGLAPGMPVPAAKQFLARCMVRLAPSFTLDNGLDLANLAHDPAVIRAYQADPLVHARISARLGLDLLDNGRWIQAHAAGFPLPLLLVQGSQDQNVSVQANTAFAQAAPAAKITYKVWDGLYHETHNEPEQQQVIEYLVQWIERHSQGG